MRTLFFLIVFSCTNVFAEAPKVIYGEDNRVDVKDSDNAMYRELSASTAAQVKPSSLKQNSSGWGSAKGDFIVSGPTMQQRGMCETERFAKQITAARCSGFLVGKDLLVTAGHCVRSESDCSGYKWVFGYKMAEDKGAISVPEENVYGCSKIVEQTVSGWGSDKDDYALIKLDREVVGRRTLEFRRSGKPEVNDKLVVIGHPTGLPTKIADGAWVRSTSNKFFSANLDTYGGNSGSAVFNADSGVIEGILVRGARDYVRDPERGCMISNVVTDDYGSGEDVTYITNIEALKEI